jgi:ABC-type iron transport system FetAB ATPase subunit
LIGIFGSILVFNPAPWYEPSVFVPTVGMMIGNSISGPALAVDRLLADISDKRHEAETRLAFGATSFEAVLPTIRSALAAALMPLINTMSVVGLVSIPGMMTGQILGGSSPLAAATYQIAILCLIVGVSATSTYVATQLALNHAVFINHRLTSEKITKKPEGKVDVEVALFQSLVALAARGQRLISSSSSSAEAVAEIPPTTSYNVLALSSPSSHAMMSTSAHSDEDSFAPAYRAEYELVDLPVTALKGSPTGPADYFHVSAVNVMSNHLPLFGPGGLSFELRQGERLIISGSSGLGKTRLLRALSHLDAPLVGSMGCSSTLFPESSIPSWRVRVLYVPQALPPMTGTPKQLLRESMQFDSRAGQALTDPDLDTQCNIMEDSLGLQMGKLGQSWLSLSGGERQRAAIALGLILATTSAQKAVLCLDEPTAACDEETMLKVERAILDSKLSAIIITHNSEQAERLGHKRLILTAATKNSNVGDVVEV